MGSHLVQRTANARRPTVEHMGIEHRRFDIAMAQQLLDGSNVIAAFEQVGGERMAERMARGSFRETGRRHGVSDSFLHPFRSPKTTRFNTHMPVSMQRILVQ